LNHGTHQCTDRLILCSPRALSDHAYPAHTPFGGYKQSGFGRENHKMALNDYRQVRDGTLPRVCGLSQAQPRAPSETQLPYVPLARQTKNMLISLSKDKLGFF